MEVSSIIPEMASEDKALKSLLDTFGSAFSLQDIASAFCKAGQNPDLVGQILFETQTNPSTHELHISNEPSIGRSRSQASEINGFKAPMLKRNAASMGTVSSVLGKNYVWRVAKSNGNLDGSHGTKPLKVDATECVMPASSNDHSLASRDANSKESEHSSLRRDANLNDDVENFLFEMLGRGFQLERSAIHEVLGRCGYDMKTSLETLLDLTAANLDKKYDLHKESISRSNSETFRSQNQGRNQTTAQRFGNNGVSSRELSGRYEQQKEVLTSLFHAPERPDSTVSASTVKSARRAWAERLVAEPLDDLSYEPKVFSTRLRLADLKDEADDNPYQILRKAVKEHRNTMKEYYRAATEAFASGDRARATLLLEKGQYFCNKAREADEESAVKIFETGSGNDEMQDDMPLDLQDHEAKEAIKLVKCHLRSLSGISSIKNLKVTVGNGGREAEKRRRLVIKLLERADINWSEDETSGTILIRLDEINPQNLSFAKKC